MTKLDPEKLQLPPTFLLSVHSLPQIRRAFFSDSFFSFQIVSMLYSLTPTTSLPAFSSQPSFLMRRKLAGLFNPHASSPVTSCTEKALQHASLPTAAHGERWVITAVWLRAWHLLYTGGGVYARGQGCSVDETVALHWQTIQKWSQGQATRFILESVAGGRHNSGRTE